MQSNYISSKQAKYPPGLSFMDQSKTYSTNTSANHEHSNPAQNNRVRPEQFSNETSRKKLQLETEGELKANVNLTIDPEEYQLRKSALFSKYFESNIVKNSQNFANPYDYMTNPYYANKIDTIDSNKIQELYKRAHKEASISEDLEQAESKLNSIVPSLKASLLQQSPPSGSFVGDQKISKNLYEQLSQMAGKKQSFPVEQKKAERPFSKEQRQAFERLMELFQTETSKHSQANEQNAQNESDFLKGLESEIQEFSNNISPLSQNYNQISDKEKLLFLEKAADYLQGEIKRAPQGLNKQMSNIDYSNFQEDQLSVKNNFDAEELYNKFNNKNIKIPQNLPQTKKMNFEKQNSNPAEAVFTNLKISGNKPQLLKSEIPNDILPKKKAKGSSDELSEDKPSDQKAPKIFIKIIINETEVPVYPEDDTSAIAKRYFQLSSLDPESPKLSKLKNAIQALLSQRLSALISKSKSQKSLSPIRKSQKANQQAFHQRTMRPVQQTPERPKDVSPSPKPQILQGSGSYSQKYETRKEPVLARANPPKNSQSTFNHPQKSLSEIQDVVSNKKSSVPNLSVSQKQYNSSFRANQKNEPTSQLPAQKSSQLKPKEKEVIIQTTAGKLLEQSNIANPSISKIQEAKINPEGDYISRLEEKYQPLPKQMFQQQTEVTFEVPIEKQGSEVAPPKKIIDVEITKSDDPYEKALEIIEAKGLNFIHYDKIVESIKAFQKNC